MKIRKIIDICKKNNKLFLFNTENEQWISDGCALYPLFNLPRFDGATICRTYDITDKQQGKIHFRYENELPKGIDFSDTAENECLAERGPIYLSDAGRGIIPYMTSQGVAFLDATYLQPLSDMENDMLEVYERQMDNGQIYFAVKSGFLLVGIIMPAGVVNDQFVERLKSLTKQCEIALYNKKSEKPEEQTCQMGL